MRVILVLASASLSGLLSCASSDCTSMGCDSALKISLMQPVGGPGEYAITGTMDGVEIQCTYDASTVQPGSSRDCGQLFIDFDASGSLTSISAPQVEQLSL